MNVVRSLKLRIVVSVLFSAVLLSFFFFSCSAEKTPVVAMFVMKETALIENGFLEGMEESGYKDGENIKYSKVTIPDNIDEMGSLIKKEAENGVDIMFCITTPWAIEASKVLKGSDIPILFISYDPIGAGIVKSRNDHGNITGIQIGGSIPKALKIMADEFKDMRTMYVPLNPGDTSGVTSFNELKAAADEMGIKTIVARVTTEEDTRLSLQNVPKDADGLFYIASSLLGRNIDDYVKASIDNKIPFMGSVKDFVDSGVLMTFGTDFFELGKQMSRLASKILNGEKATDIPIENAEYFLSLNLETAEKIGIEFSQQFLKMADKIVR